MQQGVNQALARRSKSRRMETRKGGEAKDRFSSASHCRINNWSAGLDEQPFSGNSEKACHLERNSKLTDYPLIFSFVRPLDFGQLNYIIWAWLQPKQELASICSSPEHTSRRSHLLSGLCTSSGVACNFQSEKEDWARQGRKKLSPLLFSSLVTRRRSYRARSPPPHM